MSIQGDVVECFIGFSHTHEVDSTTVWVSVILRKCVICRRRKIYSKKMFYCEVCGRYAHKRCLEIMSKQTEQKVRFADAENGTSAADKKTTSRGSRDDSNTDRRRQNAPSASPAQQRNSADNGRTEANKGSDNRQSRQGGSGKTNRSNSTNNDSDIYYEDEAFISEHDLQVADKKHPVTLEIICLTKKTRRIKPLSLQLLQDSVPEPSHSCAQCIIFQNELKTLEVELENMKIPDMPVFEKNEFKHKNDRTVPESDELANTNTQIGMKRSQGLGNCFEEEKTYFWTNATRTTEDWHVKPIAIAVATNFRSRTGREIVTATPVDDDVKRTARDDRCMVVAVVEKRLPVDEAPTTVIFVDDTGGEWTVTHARALEMAGIPARCSRFLSRMMDETIRDGKDRNGTTVLRHPEKTPVEFTVMRAKTSYIIGSSAWSPFFRIRVDAFDTSLERTAHDHFVMAYERRGQTIRAELFELPEMSDVFGVYR